MILQQNPVMDACFSCCHLRLNEVDQLSSEVRADSSILLSLHNTLWDTRLQHLKLGGTRDDSIREGSSVFLTPSS